MPVGCYLEITQDDKTYIHLCCTEHGRIHDVQNTHSDAAIAAEVTPIKVKHMIDYHA